MSLSTPSVEHLYRMDGDGDADDHLETTLRTLANDVYALINEH